MHKQVLILYFLYSLCAHAQEKIIVSWKILGSEAVFIRKNVSLPNISFDSIKLSQQIRGAIFRCNELSFLQATIIGLHCEHDSCIVEIDPGKSFRWSQLRQGNVPQDLLSDAGFRAGQFDQKSFDRSQFAKKAERILTILENQGYPFASLRLDSVIAGSDLFSACMNLQKGPLMLFDTLDIRGNANIKRWYVEKYLGIRQGMPYNEQLIKSNDSRLSQLPFLKTTRPSAIIFFARKARPVLFLENRKVSSIDGVVGFAPSSTLNNQLQITGEANLKLQNILGSGKGAEVNYRSFSTSSQDLKFRFQWPYIFRSNITLDYQFGLLKYDTLYLDVTNEIGLQYRFIGTDYFKVFYSLQTTTLITIDTNQVKASRALPQNSDIRYDQYGIGFNKTRYDYFLNPRKGYHIDFTVGVGMKQVLVNNTIRNLLLYDNVGNPYHIYDSLKMQFVQYKMVINADYFIPIANRAAFRTQLMASHIQADNIFRNELFRIGGIKTLKGFDEQSIFASSYAIFNMELRYLLQQNSNFMLFWNGAWYRNVDANPTITDKPSGFGAGMNFETGAGIFSVFYAVGKQFGNSINYNQAKIHFGFVNYF